MAVQTAVYENGVRYIRQRLPVSSARISEDDDFEFTVPGGDGFIDKILFTGGKKLHIA
jgi:hypothetical protein